MLGKKKRDVKLGNRDRIWATTVLGVHNHIKTVYLQPIKFNGAV